MSDPLDAFFGLPPRNTEDAPLPPTLCEDADVEMGAVESAAISEDVTLVRKELRNAITVSASKLDTFLDLAAQMQEPEMINAAAKMLGALSTLSTALVNIDIRVLQESKKVKDRDPRVVPTAETVPEGERFVTESTTAEVLKLMRESRVAPKEKSDGDR